MIIWEIINLMQKCFLLTFSSEINKTGKPLIFVSVDLPSLQKRDNFCSITSNLCIGQTKMN